MNDKINKAFLVVLVLLVVALAIGTIRGAM